jgi:neutral ceramidase
VREKVLRPALFPALLGLLLAGCLALDDTPLEERPFFARAKDELRALEVPASVSGPLSAGAFKVDITPPVGLPLAGFGGRTSTGIHDPVYARALVLSNGQVTVAVLAVDLIAVTDELAGEVARRVSRALPLSEDRVMVAATHTHSGPGALGRRFWERLAAGPFDPEYFERTVENMADAVVKAHRDLRRSRLRAHRFDSGDLLSNRIRAQGPEDPEVQVLVFESLDESRTAYLVNFSAHPTVLGRKNRLVSGDFPGHLCRALEEREGVVALYTSGAVGDQRPRAPRADTRLERAEKMGRLLADRVTAAPPLGPPQDRVLLSSTRISLPLPEPQLRITATRRLPTWVGKWFFEKETQLQLVTVDRTVLIGVPGELGSEIALTWKEKARARGNDALVVSLANDYIGYILPSPYYTEPIYESRLALYGPYVADYMDLFVSPFLQARPEAR